MLWLCLLIILLVVPTCHADNDDVCECTNNNRTDCICVDASSATTHKPVINVRYVNLLKHEGIITMENCTKNDSSTEFCQCEWMIHMEDGHILNATLEVDLPPQEGCVLCHLKYGYAIDLDTHVVEETTCAQNASRQYHSKNSMWIAFSCLGPGSHDKLQWVTSSGRRYKGFKVVYKIHTYKSSLSLPAWELSTIFTLVVMVLFALAMFVIGYVVWRSCKSQSIQQNILHTRNCVRRDSRVRKLQPARHRQGLHERAMNSDSQHEWWSYNQKISTVSGKMTCTPDSSLKNSTDDCMETITPQPGEVRAVKSNHTYISIINSGDPSDPEPEIERHQAGPSSGDINPGNEYLLVPRRLDSLASHDKADASSEGSNDYYTKPIHFSHFKKTDTSSVCSGNYEIFPLSQPSPPKSNDLSSDEDGEGYVLLSSFIPDYENSPFRMINEESSGGKKDSDKAEVASHNSSVENVPQIVLTTASTIKKTPHCGRPTSIAKSLPSERPNVRPSESENYTSDESYVQPNPPIDCTKKGATQQPKLQSQIKNIVFDLEQKDKKRHERYTIE